MIFQPRISSTSELPIRWNQVFDDSVQDEKDEELRQSKNNACDDVQVITAGRKRMAQTARIQRDSVLTGREAIP